MWRSVTLLPVPLRPRMTKAAAARHVERHVVQHLARAERLGHVLEPHGRRTGCGRLAHRCIDVPATSIILRPPREK